MPSSHALAGVPVVPVEQNESDRIPSGRSYNRLYILIAVGMFVTTFVQQDGFLGKYPTFFLLKHGHGFGSERIAAFMLWAAMAWNVKPIVGLIADRIPKLRGRQLNSIGIGAIAAAGFWALMGASRGDV